MAKNDNLTDFLTDVADAIRAKKGTTDKINPQNFADEIASIKSEGGVSINRVTYLRRVGDGYIDTGISGANDNLKIVVRYAMRVFPTGYWRFITAYENESTNTTRIILNKNNQVLGNINSVASGGSATLTRTGYTGVIYTETVEPTSDTSFKLASNGQFVSKTRTSGNTLEKTIHIFPDTSDTIDTELYQCQIYDGDVLVRNFFPCIRGEEFGLWDTVTEKFYGNDGSGAFTGEVINTEKIDSTTRPTVKWTGHVDVEGLKAIGWDDDDIAYLQKYVNWNEEDDDKHKVSDANKALYGILTEKNIATYKYDIIYLPKIDTSTRTNFSNFFYNWYWLEGIPFIDTSNATNVSGMFRACCSLLAVPPINTSKATNVSRLFNDCRQLTEVPWVDTSKATDTSYMYLNCSSLVLIPEIDTSSSKNMTSMFQGCTYLPSVPALNCQNVTNMSSMFNGCNNIISIPPMNTQKVTTMASMFQNCYRLTDIPEMDTSAVTSMASMFYCCRSLVNPPKLNTQSVTNMSSMFYSCSVLAKAPDLNTSNVTTTASMFHSCFRLTEIPNYDLKNVTTFASMFNACSSLVKTQSIDASNATTLDSMFISCSSLKQVPEITIEKATIIKNMFSGCISLTSVPVLNTSMVTDVVTTFTGCSALIIVPEFDLQSVTTTPSTTPFRTCYNLQHIKVKNLKVNISFENSYKLSKESILYMINNEASTSAITIKLASNVYTDIIEDADVIAALAAHPNVSLAK